VGVLRYKTDRVTESGTLSQWVVSHLRIALGGYNLEQYILEDLRAVLIGTRVVLQSYQHPKWYKSMEIDP
jgi:hypothetical protein